MKDLKETETIKNLLKSFERESQSINMYTYYASIAKNEGYVEIEKMFTEAADNKKEHAEEFLKFLTNSDLSDEAAEIPEGGYTTFLGNTKENLLAAAASENEELSNLYSHFADTEQEESAAFINNETTLWKCNNCGYTFESISEPEVCPVCGKLLMV